ncbi:MAG: protease HtpX [Bdellovibrionaceae bacterium]|nr:protease HtpX [Pseudobdellovibrionaceae bacterium]
MQVFKRIGLFLLTNILVVVTIGIAWSLISAFFGLEGINKSMGSLLVFCSLFGFGGALISLLLSKVMAKWMAGVKVIDPNTNDPTLRHLVNRVHELAARSGLPRPPEVGIYESDDVNAFATGPSKRNALVAVSTGLLRRMSDDEVDGVLGHEIAHIANGDMVTLTLITGVVNTFAMFFSRILANLIASNVDEKIRPVVHFAVVIVGDILFTMLGSMVVSYFSRQREFRADLGGAKYSGRQNMIAALRRLQTVYQIPADTEEKDMLATMKISNRKGGGLMSLFKTHPDLEDRIQALQRAAV